MRKMIKRLVLNAFVIMIAAPATAFAGVIHSNMSSQQVSLADLSGRSYPTVGGENFWIIGAMIAVAIVLMLIDWAKEKKAKASSADK